MTQALPTKQRMTRFDTSDRITISLTPDMGVKPPKNPVIAIDNGSLYEKVAMLTAIGDGTSIVIEKMLNFIAEQERGKSRVKSATRIPVKGNLEVTYRGKTYVSDRKGASLGGTSGLHGDKMERLTLRVLFALTLLGLGNGEEIDLSVTTFFTPGQFKAQEQAAKKALSQALTWTTPNGRKSASIKTLQIYPEGYHLGFYRALSTPENPGITGEWSARYDIGYRTFLCDFVDPDGYFDDDRSRSFDGKGTSLFYQWVAEEAGIDNPEDPQFIAAVNAGAQSYRPQGAFEDIPIADAVETAHEWYIGELSDLATDCTPPEISSSVVGGGGAYQFGATLLKHLRGSDRYVCDEPDIANVVAQTIKMAREL
jgi:hypothetical protein